MKVLVWQWGRYGAGPRIAVDLARGFDDLPGVSAQLSLSRGAEILGQLSESCAFPVRTYDGLAGFVLRAASAPHLTWGLVRQVRRMRPDFAICAMPGPLDLIMQTALRRCGVPMAIIVHDAQAHPGDGYPLQLTLQRLLVNRADVVVTFSAFIADRLRAQGMGRPVITERLPPMGFDRPLPPAGMHEGPLRLLSFGRLLPYKGLDLLLKAMRALGERSDLELRVVGSGPHSAELAALAALPGVSVENRWVPEEEVRELIGWSDALILPYREASQSGVGAMAVAARRLVVATDVGGLVEQFEPDMAEICRPDGEAIAAGIRNLLARRQKGDLTAAAPVDTWSGLAARLIDSIGRYVPSVKAAATPA